MKKLALLHFQPLEKYPPVMNMINLLGEIDELNCVVITISNSNSWYTGTAFSEIIRLSQISSKATGRYLGYFKYNLISLLKLIQLKPNAILGYETYSIWPIYVYQKWNKSARVHLHYHEYVSPDEIKKSSLYYKYLHRLEKKVLRHAATVSQTNSDRMQLFIRDYPFMDIKNTAIWPNYPPISWHVLSQKQKKCVSVEVIKLVHVGAVGMETMYVEQLVNWVIAQQGKYTLDFITDNIDNKAKMYIQAKNNSLVNIRKGVNYFELPDILAYYHVGLTLYKGHIPNYVYNVPNKVIEYLVCGLLVAYTKELISTRKFITEHQIANCVELDFSDLTDLQFQEKLTTAFKLPDEIVLLMNKQLQDIKQFIQLMISA